MDVLLDSFASKVLDRLARIRRTIRPQGSPILVYQMGKVGSSTVYKSLYRARVRSPLYHLHMLNNLDAIEAKVRAAYAAPTESLRQIAIGRRLRRAIVDDGRKPCRIITLVRDPVARNVSAFFQNIDQLIPDIRARYQKGDVQTQELTDVFVEKYLHDAPLQWFDSQLRDVFGIDVFGMPFPAEDGFLIVRSEPAALLILRLEDLTRCFTPAIGEFLDLPDIPLVNANVSDNDWYTSLYRDFVEYARLPADYLRSMYSSPIAKHFYSASELDRFHEKWASGADRQSQWGHPQLPDS